MSENLIMFMPVLQELEAHFPQSIPMFHIYSLENAYIEILRNNFSKNS